MAAHLGEDRDRPLELKLSTGVPVPYADDESFTLMTRRGTCSPAGSRSAQTTLCVDRGRQWSRAANIWHNAGIRSGIYMSGAPIRLFARPFRRGG